MRKSDLNSRRIIDRLAVVFIPRSAMFSLQHIVAIFICIASRVECKPHESIHFLVDQTSDLDKFQSNILEQTEVVTNFNPGLKTIEAPKSEELVINPQLENGKFFQGDMILQPDQMEFLKSNVTDKESLASRTGVLHETYRWPKDKSGHVIVAYEIADYHYSEFQLALLLQVVQLFSS